MAAVKKERFNIFLSHALKAAGLNGNSTDLFVRPKLCPKHTSVIIRDNKFNFI